MNRKSFSPWIATSLALAVGLLLCISDLLTLPYTRNHLFPSMVTPIADWMNLGAGSRSVLADLFIWPIPLAILVTNLVILIIARNLRWYPIWLAWAALSVPVAILGSVLMAAAASLPFFTSVIPWGLAIAVLSALILDIAKRKGWHLLWPWVVTLLFSASYVFLVTLSLLLRHLGIVRPLL